MSIEVDTITGPAFLACALINGDTSSLDSEDLQVLERFTEKLGDWRVVSMTDDEPRFTWSFSLHGGDAEGGNVVDYIIHRIV